MAARISGRVWEGQRVILNCFWLHEFMNEKLTNKKQGQGEPTQPVGQPAAIQLDLVVLMQVRELEQLTHLKCPARAASSPGSMVSCLRESQDNI